MPGITRRLAEFSLELKYDDLPRAVVAGAKHGILDLLGVALLGSADKSTRMILQACEPSEDRGTATVVGTDTQTSPAKAAWVNAFAAHALDYDDTQHNCNTHMSAPVLGSALALAGALRCSGKTMLTAYVAGFELGCRLGRVRRFGRHLQQQGVHPTGLLGHFGAVTAAGKLVGLDGAQMRRSLGIAATQAAGLTRSFGTMCKPLNAANAAQDAVLSALLAKQGFTGPEQIFEGEGNIFSVYGARTAPDELVQDLGQQFEISRNTIKVYACAGWRNPILEAAILLATTHRLQPEDIRKATVRACADQTRLPNYPKPRTGLEGNFSAEHAAAVAFADRAGGMKQFTDERVADPALAELRDRITLETDVELSPYQIRVLVYTADGRELSHFIPAQKGDPRNPLSWDELVAKFRANAATVLSPQRAEKLAAMIRDLEGLGNVAELMHLCRPDDAKIRHYMVVDIIH